jgi:hypothetical protein
VEEFHGAAKGNEREVQAWRQQEASKEGLKWN